MAPWPDQGSEPKAPDKDDKLVEVVTKLELEENSESVLAARNEQIAKQAEEKEVLTLDEGQLKALLDEAITYKNPKDREGKSELFKELLQEAEADESDSKGLGSTLTGKLPRGYYNLPVRRRHPRHQGRECGVGVSTTRGGSLQNLHALGMEGGRGGSSRSRRSGRSGETLVSARQREGGSLPSNVNVDNDPDLDDTIICPNYTSRATLEVTGLGKEENSTAEEPNPILFQGHCLPNGTEQVPVQLGSGYNSVRSSSGLNTTKEDESDHKYASSICVGPVESGAMLYPPSPIQHVSVLSIPPPQIHVGPDENRITDSSEHKKFNINRSRHKKCVVPRSDQALTAPDEDNTDVVNSEGLLGFPLTAHWNTYSSFTFLDFRDPSTRLATFGKESADGKTKSLDENGNALGCLRMDSNCLDRKKQRRVKTKNDKNFILAEEIEGFRGGADIDTLMEYIESPSSILDGSKANKARANQTNGPRNHVKMRAKEEDSRPIKRRTKEKLQRCNSLEEISKTKLEDLTEESSSERVNGSSHTLTKKQVTLDDAQLGKKSSWDDETYLEESTTMMKRNRDCKLERASPDGIQDAEFHVVTKKQRKKKRRTGCSGRVGSKPVYHVARGFPAHDRTLERDGSSGLLYQYRHRRSDQTGSQPRRKSASSVPPSDKSDSSDLDSVHSLPVSSTTTRTKVGKNSVSGGSTPQASYADIARTMASPPDIGSQGNICRQGKYSPYLSCAGPFFEMSSSDPIPSVMLPAPFAPSLFKKDAMTDTTCDTFKPALPNEEYPPLEIKNSDLYIDITVKQTRNAPRDNNISEDKVSIKTVPVNFVIPISDSGDVPHSLPVDMPSSCVKSSPAYSNSKRPPVILMDEPMVNSQVPTELTFGFEVNQQLLQCDDSMCNLNNVLSSSFMASTSSIPAPSTTRDSSMRRLIQFLSLGWDDAMKDLRVGRAIYYNGQ